MKRMHGYALSIAGGLLLGALSLACFLHASAQPYCCQDLKDYAAAQHAAADKCLHQPGCDWQAAQSHANAADDQLEAAYRPSPRSHWMFGAGFFAVCAAAGTILGCAWSHEELEASA